MKVAYLISLVLGLTQDAKMNAHAAANALEKGECDTISSPSTTTTIGLDNDQTKHVLLDASGGSHSRPCCMLSKRER